MKLFTFTIYTICFLLACGTVHAQKRPNIVIIISDDHSYQTISAYGSKVGYTPQIDRIANEGTIFNRPT